MNANTASKISEAIDQAVWCGESIADIKTHIAHALSDAQRRLAEARVKEAQANLEALRDAERYCEPTDDDLYNRHGVEGGIAYDTTYDEPGSLGENDWRL